MTNGGSHGEWRLSLAHILSFILSIDGASNDAIKYASSLL